MEFIARHNISSGPKGKRQRITAGQRFDPADYPEVTVAEWEAMKKNGNVLVPSDPNYVSPAVFAQTQAPVVEGRSPRTDTDAVAERRAARMQEDEPEEEEEPLVRRRRTAKAEDDDAI